MHPCARLAYVLTLLATPAAAQSTTEDGIRAMLRGDYQVAARILRPLVDDAAQPDPAAEFFLAVLYDTRLDKARGCGLFVRAATRTSPFSEQSAVLARVMREQLGSGASVFCVADDSWRGGPPQSFALGPDHRIVFTDTRVRVIYGDKEQGTALLPRPESVFLPIQYTPLPVTRPTVTRRHFFQWLEWVPDTTVNPWSWALTWALSEVVGDQWVSITYETNLAVAKGPTPPVSTDVTNLVRLHVNASGEAELTIVGGAAPRTEIIRLPDIR